MKLLSSMALLSLLLLVAPFECTRMAPKAEVTFSSSARGFAEPTTTPAAGPVFADAAPLPIINAANYAWKNDTNITAADIDGDLRIDLFITAGDRNAVLLNRGDAFELARDHPLVHTEDVNAALWGDFDNDGLLDVYLARHGPNQLWRQVERGKWQDVTEQTRTYGGNLETVAGASFDADHDGDLDLFLVNSNAPNQLLDNDGNGAFRALGAETGLAGDGRPSRGVVVNDLDNDGDADILVLRRQPPHDVFLNERFGNYRRAEGLDAFTNKPIDSAVAVDVDADGQVELYATTSQGLVRWTRKEQGVWQEELLDANVTGAFHMLDVDGGGVLQPVQAPQFARWTPVVLDPAAGPAIIGLRAGRPMILRPAPGRGNFLTLALSGKSTIADPMRSNASGVGVAIAVRVDDRWIVRDTYPHASAAAGQSLQPVPIGLGSAPRADVVRLTWPEGSVQIELHLPAGHRHEIKQTPQRPSSS